MNYVELLVVILATFAGGLGGSLLTIDRYHRIANERAAYEEELAQAQDVLAGLALLRRMRTRNHRGPGHPEDWSSGSWPG